MPYRRLPKTDKKRLYALQKAIELENRPLSEVPISPKMIEQAKAYFPVFQTLVFQFQTIYNRRVDANKKYTETVKNARMYLSHFIQVLNMTVQRGEIKKDLKKLYNLDPDDYTVPDISNDKNLEYWGNLIINGENERIAQGGIPLSHPNIARVKMHYDIFAELKVSQNTHNESTIRNHQKVKQMREQVDELILMIWDAVEQYYANLLPYARYEACRKCGVIYYYRTGEKHLTPKTDENILLNEKSTLLLDFEEENQDSGIDTDIM